MEIEKIKKILKKIQKQQKLDDKDLLMIFERLDDMEYRLKLVEKILEKPLAELHKLIEKQNLEKMEEYLKKQKENIS